MMAEHSEERPFDASAAAAMRLESASSVPHGGGSSGSASGKKRKQNAQMSGRENGESISLCIILPSPWVDVVDVEGLLLLYGSGTNAQFAAMLEVAHTLYLCSQLFTKHQCHSLLTTNNSHINPIVLRYRRSTSWLSDW